MNKKLFLIPGAIALLAIVPGVFASGAFSQPSYSITPKSQTFVNNEFHTSICTSAKIETVKIILTAPDGSWATSTFKLKGHCISYDAYVPNDQGTFKIVASFFSHGELKGKASAMVGN